MYYHWPPTTEYKHVDTQCLLGHHACSEAIHWKWQSVYKHKVLKTLPLHTQVIRGCLERELRRQKRVAQYLARTINHHTLQLSLDRESYNFVTSEIEELEVWRNNYYGTKRRRRE